MREGTARRRLPHAATAGLPGRREPPPPHRDRLLALRFGATAVRMVEQKQFGHLVAYHPPHMVPVPIEEAIAVTKTVPLDSDTVQTARDLDLCLAD